MATATATAKSTAATAEPIPAPKIGMARAISEAAGVTVAAHAAIARTVPTTKATVAIIAIATTEAATVRTAVAAAQAVAIQALAQLITFGIPVGCAVTATAHPAATQIIVTA